MQEKLNKGILFGMLGNVAFVVFGLVCLVYYYTYTGGVLSRILEAVAYGIEVFGFGMLIYSDYLLIASARFRRLMKISFTAYIILEALMMILELNSGSLSFYQPYSLPLAIVHAVVSAAACFSFLQLDADNTKFEVVIVAAIAAILAGMFGNILGVRIYFSIIINALGFAFLFGSILFLMKRGDIDIDCYGDRARVAEFSSESLFSDPEVIASAKQKNIASQDEANETNEENEDSE